MQIENSFAVKAPPDRVYEFLLDVNNVVSCVPGAELSEVVDPDTFKGKVRIKVGPVTVSYNGTARITSRDPATRTATLEAEGRETTGSGSAQATTVMAVAAAGEASTVTLTTDFTVVGRVAQFGRGIMEDVSRHLVAQAAECIQSKLEAPPRLRRPLAAIPRRRPIHPPAQPLRRPRPQRRQRPRRRPRPSPQRSMPLRSGGRLQRTASAGSRCGRR